MQGGTKMKNTIRLRLKKPQPNTKIKEVMHSLHAIDKECYKHVIGCSQVYSNRMWFVSFQSSFECSILVGREIILGGEKIVIEDANYEFKHATYKVHWLPLGSEIRNVIKFVHEDLNPQKDAIITVDASKDTTEIEMSEDVKVKVETGVFRIKVKYLKTTAVKNICWVKKIGEDRILITKVGKKSCFLCQSKTHIAKNCEKNKVICRDCGKKGHGVACTFATKLNNKNNDAYDMPEVEEENEDGDEYYDEEEEKELQPQTPGKNQYPPLTQTNAKIWAALIDLNREITRERTFQLHHRLIFLKMICSNSKKNLIITIVFKKMK